MNVATPTWTTLKFSACRLLSSRSLTGNGPLLQALSTHVLSLSRANHSAFRPTGSLWKSPAIEESVSHQAAAGLEYGEDTSVRSEDGKVPWYLQVDPPRHPTLLHEPVPLPQVPEDAPRLVEPLIRFVSDDLGLDELSLLDLRELDPPAALGPELLMLFGTARSERHLHVSADRLLRWLRGRHGLAVRADGLLGRNVLKTKLRRKARKVRLLGGSGSLRETDDGISTDWICVNLGTLGVSDEEIEFLDEDGNPAGFGLAQSGTTVVVQILTESRREEMKLEEFWTDLLLKSRRRSVLPESVEAGNQSFLTDGSRRSGGSGLAATSATLDRRYFSTCPRRLADPIPGQSPRICQLAAETIDDLAIEEMNNTLLQDVASKSHVLRQLKLYVEKLRLEEVRMELNDAGDGSRTSFWRLFDLALHDLGPKARLEAHIWVHVALRRIGHPSATLSRSRALLEDMRGWEVGLGRETSLELVKAILVVPGEDDTAVREQCDLAMEVMDDMAEQGYKILSHDVLVTIIETVLKSGARSAEAERVLSNFEYLFTQVDLPCPSEDLLLRLLDAYAGTGDWERFWQTWRIPPKHVRPRSARMYACVFQRVADTGHQLRAADALRWCVDEMMGENPGVRMSRDLKDALKACIRVADPTAQMIVERVLPNEWETIKLYNREFTKLLRQLG